jgi:hypothetical protein
MNCQTFENIIDDLAREQLIETNARQEALRHTEECSACAVRLVDERAITVGLRALAEDMQAAEAPARIQTELLAAFQQRQVVQLVLVSRVRRWSYLGAAAAVLLMGVAIGLAAWNWNSNGVQRAENPVPTLIRSGETQPSGIAVTANGGGSKGKLETAPSEVTVSAGTYRRTGNARRRNARQTTSVGAANNLDNSAANVEVATDFMPIGYVNSQSLQDGGSVVRVELSRSTIVSMGFAVNMDRYGERVKADVLMGADGLARAIRFVQ